MLIRVRPQAACCPSCSLGKSAPYARKALKSFVLTTLRGLGKGAHEMSTEVRVYRDAIDGECQVWIELDMKYSGICVGCGETRDAAVASAVAHLGEIITELQSGETKTRGTEG